MEQQLVYLLEQASDDAKNNIYLALEKFEPILSENNDRFVLFPIQYQDVWDSYKRALSSFWTTGEVCLADDVLQWRDNNQIDDGTKHFIKQILAFFAAADGIVNENLASRFFNEVQVPEIRCFYGFQIAIENIHNEQYSLLIDSYIESKSEKDHLLKAIETIPTIKSKADWAIKWLHSNKPFNQRLVAFACIEGIMFSGAFCAIYWIKKRGLLSGLCMSNELISRDEGSHAEFACLLYSKHLKYKAPDDVVLEIVKEAVDLEIEFITQSIPCNLIGMKCESMSQYIKFVADRLLQQLGLNSYYNVKNPFDWMDRISMDNKTNFFERRVTEYSRAGFSSNSTNHNISNLNILDDF